MATIERFSGGQPMVVTALETGSEAYKAGDPVKFSSGKVVIGTAGAFIGFARKDASGTANVQCEVELFDPNAIYCVKYKSSATSQALVGSVIDVDFSGTKGALVVDDSGATTDFYVVALDSRDVVGTSGGRLLVRIKPTMLT